MEIQFEITCQLEKKHYVEYFQYIWRKRMIWFWILVFTGSAGILLNLLTKETIAVIKYCVAIAYAIFLYFRPWMAAAKVMKDKQRFYETDAVSSVTKFGDVILDETKRQTSTVPYDKIAEIFISKNVIVLEDITKADLIMDKSNFTKGNFEEFLKFIQEKCPQAKVIIR